MSAQADNVNVKFHAQRAQDRVRSNGRLRDFNHAPEPSFWQRYFKWEANLTVANRVIEKGWVVPQPLGIALLVIILGGVGGLYWRIIDKQVAQETTFNARMSEQRDLLIRLDQRLIDKNDHDKENFQTLEDRFQSVEAWQQVTNDKLAQLKRK